MWAYYYHHTDKHYRVAPASWTDRGENTEKDGYTTEDAAGRRCAFLNGGPQYFPPASILVEESRRRLAVGREAGTEQGATRLKDLATKLKDLEGRVSTRTLKILIGKLGLDTVESVARFTRGELSRVDNVGPGILDEIEKFWVDAGVPLGSMPRNGNERHALNEAGARWRKTWGKAE